MTGVIAELDLSSGALLYCLAGHPPPLLLRNGRIVKELDAADNGGPLGLGGGPWVAAEEILEPDDRVILFTDGVVEARNAEAEFFGEARLADFVVRAEPRLEPLRPRPSGDFSERSSITKTVGSKMTRPSSCSSGAGPHRRRRTGARSAEPDGRVREPRGGSPVPSDTG